MKKIKGYKIVKTEFPGSCRGCAFSEKWELCALVIDCELNYIYKRIPKKKARAGK